MRRGKNLFLLLPLVIIFSMGCQGTGGKLPTQPELSGAGLPSSVTPPITSPGQMPVTGMPETPVPGVALAVVSTDPANDATNVERNKVVSVVFSAKIDPSSINDSTFIVKDSHDRVVEGALNSAEAIATLTPARKFAVLGTYNVTLTTGVKDSAGNVLASDHSWSFTSKDGIWSDATEIEPNLGVPRSSIDVAVDEDGNDIAVFVKYDGHLTIYSSHRVANGRWETPTPVEAVPLTANKPSIAVDRDGNALVVWYEWDSIARRKDIYANKYISGTRWGTRPTQLDMLDGDALFPKIAIDKSGNAIAVWSQNDGTDYSIYSRRYAIAGGGWDAAPVRIETAAGDAYSPKIAFDQAGNAFAVWYQQDGSTYSIFAARYAAEGRWEAPTVVELAPGEAYQHDLAVDSKGNAVVVWRQFDTSTSRWNIYAARYDSLRRDWTIPALIGPDCGEGSEPQVRVNIDGNAIAVWSKARGVYVNKYSAGERWEDAPTQLVPSMYDAPYPDIAVDDNGNAVVVWRELDSSGQYGIRTKRYAQGAWGDTQLIGPLAGNMGAPHLGMNSRGEAVVVWEFYTTVYKLFANQFE